MHFLICGLGSIGRRHLRNLKHLGQDQIVLLRTGKSTLPKGELSSYPVERDIEAALKRWPIEAVIVSNPTALHLDVAIPAAEAGCYIFLEKPISHTMERVDDFKRAVSQGGGEVFVGFQFRFHPGLQRIQELLAQSTIGDPISARVHWGEYLPGWHPWEDYRASYSARADLGGGVALTLCHPFDYLRWFFGEVHSVSAEMGNLGNLGLEVEDAAEVLIRFAAGPLTSVHLDYNQQPASHRLEIIGTTGTIRWDYDGGSTRWWSTTSGSWQGMNLPEGFERNTMFLDEMRHFLHVVCDGAAPRCTLEDGVRALEIALAAKRSAAEDGCRINLSKDSG